MGNNRIRDTRYLNQYSRQEAVLERFFFALGPKILFQQHRSSAPLRAGAGHVRFSNRPFGVKRFQTIHHYGVDVAHGLALLFGFGTKALPAWDSKTRWNNLCRGLTVRLTVGSSGSTISPHPSSREGHHSTARWNSSFLLSQLILHRPYAATTSLVHRNSVP